MNKNKLKFSLISSLLILHSAHALAEVSEAEAKELGVRLTPVGAEAGANKDGSIPAYTGGLAKDAAPVDDKGYMGDPFSSETPLFVINASNAQQYRDKLTAGQLAMLARYPDAYTIPVYKTHRSVGVPADISAAVKFNATHTKLVEDGNGLAQFQRAIAFPIPKNGLEVLWNHITRYRGGGFSRTVAQIATQANGAYTPIIFDERFTFSDQFKDYDKNNPGNILFYYRQEVTAPPRLAGQVTLVHETINQVSQPRMAWIYNAGQRRVRRAPDVAYDNPGTAADGLRTADNLDMFNGAPDRYEWKLEGKKEAYIPYNSYRLLSPKLKYADIIKPGHLNQSYTRYELHRVWEVTATLKPGARNIYTKRHLLVDEDTWQIVEVDHYDAQGKLWRVAESHPVYYYNKQIPISTADVIYDLQNGRYLAMNLRNEQASDMNFNYAAVEADYSTGALRTTGIR